MVATRGYQSRDRSTSTTWRGLGAIAKRPPVAAGIDRMPGNYEGAEEEKAPKR